MAHPRQKSQKRHKERNPFKLGFGGVGKKEYEGVI